MHYENVSEEESISATNGRFMLKINVQQRTTTLNTKTTNNKEKIHEFNFKAAKNTSFLTSISKCHLNKKNSR
jgi:hypothetical protein